MRLCQELVYLDKVAHPCHRETVAPRSPYCYWHRLSRSTMTVQLDEAQRRIDLMADHPHRARVSPQDWPTGERWCAGCQHFVPLFYCTPQRGAGLLSQCRACAHRAAVEGRDVAVYGVGRERKLAIEDRQRRKCAGCRRSQLIKDLALDHNHKTGAPRGLLCQSCNHKVLGGAYDSVNILLNLAYYLLNPPADETSNWEPPETLEFTLVVKRKEPAP